MNDELEQLRDARPHVDPPSPGVVYSARSSLMAQIQQSDHPTESKTQGGGRRRWGKAFVAVSVLATAAAGWAVIPRGGMLPEPVFVGGDTWELVVGEESNGGDGTFKVCHSFRTPELVPTDGNGLGGGCENSPDDAPPGAVIADVTPAMTTPTGVVILVDLTTTPVAEVVLTTDTGEALRLTPFVMPQSGEHFVATELPGTPTSVQVDALDPQGAILDSRVVTDLSVG